MVIIFFTWMIQIIVLIELAYHSSNNTNTSQKDMDFSSWTLVWCLIFIAELNYLWTAFRWENDALAMKMLRTYYCYQEGKHRINSSHNVDLQWQLNNTDIVKWWKTFALKSSTMRKRLHGFFFIVSIQMISCYWIFHFFQISCLVFLFFYS